MNKISTLDRDIWNCIAVSKLFVPYRNTRHHINVRKK